MNRHFRDQLVGASNRIAEIISFKTRIQQKNALVTLLGNLRVIYEDMLKDRDEYFKELAKPHKIIHRMFKSITFSDNEDEEMFEAFYLLGCAHTIRIIILHTLQKLDDLEQDLKYTEEQKRIIKDSENIKPLKFKSNFFRPDL